MNANSFIASVALSFGICMCSAHAAQPLRVAVDPTFPPMEYIESGKHTGFDVELAEALASRIGRPVQYVDMDFKGLIPSVLAGRADFVLSAIYITPERQQVVNFTDSYFTAGLVVMIKADDKQIVHPDDIDGKRVAVQVGTKSVHVISERFPKTQQIEVEKNEQMFNALETGRADAVVTGKPAALLYAKSHSSVKVLPDQLTSEEYGIALGKDNDELRTDLNKALQAMKDDGSYAKLVERWFGNAN